MFLKIAYVKLLILWAHTPLLSNIRLIRSLCCICLCVMYLYKYFKYSTRGLIFTNFCVNIVPLEATKNLVYFHFVASLLTTWRKHKLGGKAFHVCLYHKYVNRLPTTELRLVVYAPSLFITPALSLYSQNRRVSSHQSHARCLTF